MTTSSIGKIAVADDGSGLRLCRHLQPVAKRTIMGTIMGKIMATNGFAKFLIPLMLAMAPIPAFCHGSADPAAKPSVAPFNEPDSEAILQEIKVFANARISARRAIAIAERRGAGAKVVDLSFDGTTPRLAYRVKVL